MSRRILQYCTLYFVKKTKTSLPILDIKAHTTILSNLSKTKLTQTFINPIDNGDIEQLWYSFPLYDGVSVVSFNCHIGDRIITGLVKESEKAKQDFNDAVESGKKAAILEQSSSASDTFYTSIGNVSAGEKVIVEITYIGELKHDAQVDGIRYTIPTIILPRYGTESNARTNLPGVSNGQLQVTVDIEMDQESPIRQIQSPSHPIAVSLGTTSIAPNADPVTTKASATLSLETTGLDQDFVIQIISKNNGSPTAILETHSTIPNQRALMVSLVPKFSLPQEKPEIVFVCDCSGSMSGSNITLAKSALKVFLKSLPIGVMFNICLFGSRHKFMWDRSQPYTESNLKNAMEYVNKISANMGGTEMFQPIKETFVNRYRDISLEVMLITDGEVWDQSSLLQFINSEVIDSKAPIRIFTLGIGNGVSHSLIEGIARAANGFSQSVGSGEKMDSKIVRMLKESLSPHVTDYTMEIKYGPKEGSADMDDDDYVMIDKVTDSFNVNLKLESNEDIKNDQQNQKPISLFDNSTDVGNASTSTLANIDSDDEKYSNLPEFDNPKLLQTPNVIPPLFNYNRTSVYLLMGPDCNQQTPKSIVLRGTSKHGPLELEIPVQVHEGHSDTIHQLAAKKYIQELEEGRGWITRAIDSEGVLLKTKFDSRFPQMVEREAVRIGVQYQIQSKWTSFVAIDNQVSNDMLSNVRSEIDPVDKTISSNGQGPSIYLIPKALRSTALSRVSNRQTGLQYQAQAFVQTQQQQQRLQQQIQQQQGQPQQQYERSRKRSKLRASREVRESTAAQVQSLSRRTSSSATSSRDDRDICQRSERDVDDLVSSLVEEQQQVPLKYQSKMETLVELQTFEGFWKWNEELSNCVGVNSLQAEELVSVHGWDIVVVATILAVLYFEKKLTEEKDSWEMMVDKSRDWLTGQIGIVGVDKAMSELSNLIQ